MKKISISAEKQVMLEGLLTLGMLENGLRSADFTCCENVEMEAFSGTFKVQGMRDGNLYMTQKPKRVKNKAIFRLPEKLVHQASAIAQKVRKSLTHDLSPKGEGSIIINCNIG